MSSALPCGSARDDVDQDDVGDLFLDDALGDRGADVAGADDRDFLFHLGAILPEPARVKG